MNKNRRERPTRKWIKRSISQRTPSSSAEPKEGGPSEGLTHHNINKHTCGAAQSSGDSLYCVHLYLLVTPSFRYFERRVESDCPVLGLCCQASVCAATLDVCFLTMEGVTVVIYFFTIKIVYRDFEGIFTLCSSCSLANLSNHAGRHASAHHRARLSPEEPEHRWWWYYLFTWCASYQFWLIFCWSRRAVWSKCYIYLISFILLHCVLVYP